MKLSSDGTTTAIDLPLTPEAKTEQVFKWILGGATDFDVVEAIAVSFPGDDPVLLLTAAIGKFRESAKMDADTVSGFCFAATRDLYRRMVEIGDFPGALKAIKQLRQFSK